MTAQDKEKLVTEIIDDALGDLSHWSMPVVAQSTGPDHPELKQGFSQSEDRDGRLLFVNLTGSSGQFQTFVHFKYRAETFAIHSLTFDRM